MKNELIKKAAAFTKKLHGKPDAFAVSGTITWENAPATTYKPKLNKAIILPGFVKDIEKFKTLDELTSLQKLSLMLWSSYGCSATRLYFSEDRPNRLPNVTSQRVIAAGGARYPGNLYLDFGKVWEKCLPGISQYIYYYSPKLHALVAHAIKKSPSNNSYSMKDDTISKELTVYVTSTYTRTSFKYKSFAYRLANVDCGLILGRLKQIFLILNLKSILLVEPEIDELYSKLELNKPSEQITFITEINNFLIGDNPDKYHFITLPNLTQESPVTYTIPDEITMMREVEKTASTNLTCRIQLEINPQQQKAKNCADVKQWLSSISNRESLAPYFTGKSIAASVILQCLNSAVSQMENLGYSNSSQSQQLPQFNIYCIILNATDSEAGYYYYDMENQQLRLIHTDVNRVKLNNTLHLSSANISLSSFIVHIAGNLDWTNSQYGPLHYRVQQLLLGAMIDILSTLTTSHGLSAHPFLGFDKDKLKQLYKEIPRKTNILAQLCVGIPKTPSWLRAPIMI